LSVTGQGGFGRQSQECYWDLGQNAQNIGTTDCQYCWKTATQWDTEMWTK